MLCVVHHNSQSFLFAPFSSYEEIEQVEIGLTNYIRVCFEFKDEKNILRSDKTVLLTFLEAVFINCQLWSIFTCSMSF